MVDEYKQIGKQKLRMGYTTGSCAAAAAKAAAQMLFSGKPVERVSLLTPKGILLDLAVEDIRFGETVSCAIRKDSGDDPDVTNGVLVYAEVATSNSCNSTEDRIRIDGGIGVGRVTKKGLEQPVGSAAINRVPRQMIREAVKEICEEQEFDGCLNVIISIPAGVELAKKTFNPNLGIEGGISVLGTSGIVEPMSETALIESIRVELKMLAANHGKTLIFSPGNYGTHYVQGRWPELYGENTDGQTGEAGSLPLLKFSNYVGEALKFAQECELESILFVAHIGKFIKVAGGIMNTHSKEADARMEILAAAALQAGASAEIAKEILDCPTTDAGLEVLIRYDMRGKDTCPLCPVEEMPIPTGGLAEKTMWRVLEKALYHLRRKVGDEIEIGLVLFSNAHETLAESENVQDILDRLRRKGIESLEANN